MSRSRRIPQAEALIVEERKVVEYLLNPAHPEGASKAKFFQNRGFTVAAWQIFADALRGHGRLRDVTEMQKTKFGHKYRVECELPTPDGKNPCVLTVWIQEGTQPPRLVTAHPNLD